MNSIKLNKSFLCVGVLLFTISCRTEDVLPKPKGYLALEYEQASYLNSDINCPFEFLVNSRSILKLSSEDQSCWFEINYPTMKGTIYMSYYKVHDNLKSLLRDAQKLPLQHEIKADAIFSDTFINEKNNTYGLFYEVQGNAASQAQFYLTDSISHFVTGSVYFKSKPNYDSILPAADYLKKDMRKMMESMIWKD